MDDMVGHPNHSRPVLHSGVVLTAYIDAHQTSFESCNVTAALKSNGFLGRTLTCSTKSVPDIEEIGYCHYRVRTYSEFAVDDEIHEFVIRKEDGIWMIRSDKFEPEPECECEYSQADHAEMWIEELGTERMEIREIFPEKRKP